MNKNVRSWSCGIMLGLLLAGCGGGGAGSRGDDGEVFSGSGSSGNNSKSPKAFVQVTLKGMGFLAEVAVGEELDITVEGSWSASKVQPGAIYLQARDPEGRFLTPPSINGTAGTTFKLTLPMLGTIAAGSYTGTIEARACKDANCSEPYPGAVDSITYHLQVNHVAEWETHQRNAAHQGYVPITLNPSSFTTAWQWNQGISGRINAVVTGNDKVFVTNDVYHSLGVLYALNESDSTEAWRVSFGTVPALNPPAVSNGRVYAATTGHSATALWSFDANTGTYIHKSPFESQWPNILAPTVFGDQAYTAGGYYGGQNYSFSTIDGTRTWTHSAGGVWDMYTPAVDDNYVYHHNGSALYLINRTTGITSATITDPFAFNSNYSYHGSPVIGGRNNVFSFAGGSFSGSASSSTEQYDQRVLSSFNIGTKSYEWSTAHAYITAPAVANGVIYAARNNPMLLDAIDEASGQVLWSWAPTGNGDNTFHRNIVVTRNILFVSTDKAVYALDLFSRAPVWSYPKPGMLAISANRTLYIATGARVSDGNLVAIKLK